jgi:serine/threonine-protein kinase
VAVKVLSPSRRSPEEAGRLEREARATASLTHPNVLAVHDVDHDGEVPYIVSELLQGETLRARLEMGPLPLRQCVDYARQIAAGLAAAHEKGIVHRDLKPDNLFLTREGCVKIVDFGLAKQAPAFPDRGSGPSSRTEPGVILGTVGYMSPEQVRGLAADERSDVFAYGAVLFEMATRRRAFSAGSPVETMSAILHDEPPDLARLPQALGAVVRRCLEKDPARRFISGRALLAALELLSDAPQPLAGSPRGAQIFLAVLPFADLSPERDHEYLGEGMAEELMAALGRIEGLRVAARSSSFRFREAGADLGRLRAELGVDKVVEGSFERRDQQLRVSVRLVSATGGLLWSTQIDTSIDHVFRMQDEVAQSIARTLEVELGPADEARSARRAAPAPGASEMYLKGRAFLQKETLSDFIAAVDAFQRARDADPEFAPAWAALADTYERIAFQFQPEGDWFSRAVAMCDRALALDPALPEGLYVRGRMRWGPSGGWDNAGALRDLIAALAGRPDLDEALDRLGVILWHVGLVDEGLSELQRVLELSPGHAQARYHVGLCRYHQGHYAEALAISEAVAREAPASWIHYQTALCQIRLGRLDEAVSWAHLMHRVVPGEVLVHPIEGLVAAARGHEEDARAAVRRIVETRRGFGHYHHAQYDVACILARFGDAEQAVRWLRDAARSGYPCGQFFERDPWLEPLHGRADWEQLKGDLRAEREVCSSLYAGLVTTRGAAAR